VSLASVSFRWPWVLPALAIVPLVLLIYVWLLRRKRKVAVRFTSLSLIRAASPGRLSWRRHVPFALLLLTIAAVVLAAARPHASVPVSRRDTSIILTLDVSRSMCATDVAPNRLAAAAAAAKEFVRDQPGGARIGIVAFAGFAQIVVAPSADQQELLAAIDALTTSFGTAIGSAILSSIDALAAVNDDIAPSLVDAGSEGPGAGPGSDGNAGGAAPGVARPPRGTNFVPDIVVLLTDGANTSGVDPLVAAGQAADRKVRVFTIGFGTTNPGSLVCTADQVGAGNFGPGAGANTGGFGGGGFGTGGGFGGAGNRFLASDDTTLQAIADITGGEFAQAENADELLEVFRDLPERVKVQNEDREIGVAFVGGAALAMVLALLLSWKWNRYP
jgi:Ca-activated chloride channel family protein